MTHVFQFIVGIGGILAIGFAAGIAVFFIPCAIFLARVGVNYALLPRAMHFAAAMALSLMGGALLMGIGGPILAVLVFVSLCRKYLVVSERQAWAWGIG
ncbi:MAG: hypothetical protein EP312_02660, partial [Gammaproteobacteria bacterium]